MQNIVESSGYTRIRRVAPIDVSTHGGRAKALQRLIRLDMPVPNTVALSFDTVTAIAAGHMIDLDALVGLFDPDKLLSVRPSSQEPDWGGPSAMLNIGMNAARHATLTNTHGHDVADAVYLRFVQSFAVNVARLDPEMFENGKGSPGKALERALKNYEAETEERFPATRAEQLGHVLKSMARAWSGTTARLLRQARGAPTDAGLGLVVQEMSLGMGLGESGQGVIRFADMDTGERVIRGRYIRQFQGQPPQVPADQPNGLTGKTESLEADAPELFKDMLRWGEVCRTKLREEMQLEFTIENGKLSIIDAVRLQRSGRAGVRIAVELAEDKVISRQEAVLRVEPRSISELLHPQVDPKCERQVVLRGIAASPGAAAGRLAFTAADAQSIAARGENCVLVKRETSPEDIRGMHAAVAVLTQRGGMTSHAAVIARGIGLPCIVGATDMRLSFKEHTITCPDGTVFAEGDTITVDGTTGTVLAGAATLVANGQDDAFQTLLGWADELRDIGVRANADSRDEARLARDFGAEGIGLCRTEHMFFAEDRLVVMREMIFADDREDRAAALERLLPMQRDDFTELFQVMPGKPVCIRLFDPPLHEFLPTDRDGIRELAEALDLPISTVARRVSDLTEVNPMLGLRGVRLGITMPEIYDMQARAIFEATLAASEKGDPVVPEVMIPLVSAKREVEIVRGRLDAVAAAVQAESGRSFEYRLGVMVETPRAALRAGEIAQQVAFLSFGTNDLTQMTYGLSRDDAGRFMNDYVNKGVFHEDPFHILDDEGVGELLTLGAERGRAAQPDVTLSICGEHGGNPESIDFCRKAGFDYVSCSPYRVPVARLAAAHLAAGRTTL